MLLKKKVHTDFTKYILSVQKYTPHVMLYEELRQFSISVTIKKQVISFWSKLLKKLQNYDTDRFLSCKIILLATNMTFCGYKMLKNIVDEEGMANKICIYQHPILVFGCQKQSIKSFSVSNSSHV